MWLDSLDINNQIVSKENFQKLERYILGCMQDVLFEY